MARGGCLCGAVTFVASGPPKWVAHCHCSMCRRAHGAAFVTWVGMPAERVSIADPAGHFMSYASSPGAERGFCRRCGSPFYFRSDRWPGEIHLARGAFVDEVALAPQSHVHFDAHVDWVMLGDALPREPLG